MTDREVAVARIMTRRLSQTIRRWVGYPDLAVDLGTATTRLSAAHFVRTLERPSAVTPTERSSFGSCPGQSCDDARVPALRGGVVVDCEAAASVLRTLLIGVRPYGLIKPRVLACAPTDASDAERSSLAHAISMAGAAAVEISPEPLAAAIGAGLDVSRTDAQTVVDIGDGVTDVAVIQSGSIAHSSAVRIACSDLHTAVQRHVADRHGIRLAPGEGARLARLVGADPDRLPLVLTARAARGTEARVRPVDVDVRELWNAVAPVYDRIIRHVAATLRDLPSPLACEVIGNGVCLTGGGALLPGLAGRIRQELSVDVTVPRDPLHAVINGARQMLSTAIEVDLWRLHR